MTRWKQSEEWVKKVPGVMFSACNGSAVKVKRGWGGGKTNHFGGVVCDAFLLEVVNMVKETGGNNREDWLGLYGVETVSLQQSMREMFIFQQIRRYMPSSQLI